MWRCINFISVICQNHQFGYLQKSGGRSVGAGEYFHRSTWSCNTCEKIISISFSKLAIYRGGKDMKIYGWQEEESAENVSNRKGRKKMSRRQFHTLKLQGEAAVSILSIGNKFLVCPCCRGWLPNVLPLNNLMPTLKQSPWDLICSGHIKASWIGTQITSCNKWAGKYCVGKFQVTFVWSKVWRLDKNFSEYKTTVMSCLTSALVLCFKPLSVDFYCLSQV